MTEFVGTDGPGGGNRHSSSVCILRLLHSMTSIVPSLLLLLCCGLITRTNLKEGQTGSITRRLQTCAHHSRNQVITHDMHCSYLPAGSPSTRLVAAMSKFNIIVARFGGICSGSDEMVLFRGSSYVRKCTRAYSTASNRQCNIGVPRSGTHTLISFPPSPTKRVNLFRVTSSRWAPCPALAPSR
jgi:hypothetical protein